MNPRLVSVIIPSYNGEEFLEQTLKSVVWQTYENWECILIDDGSTDNTAIIFQQFAEKDSRFRYFRKSNSGLAAARNSGIDLADGEFVQFLDDDDILLKDRLELCVGQFLLLPDVDVVYSDYVCHREGEGFFRSLPARMSDGEPFMAFLCDQNRLFAIIVHSLMFRRNVIDQNRFDTTLGSHAEDVECWTRIADAGATFHYLDDVLVIYRFTRDSLTQDEAKLLAAKVGILSRYVNHPKVLLHQRQFHEAMNYFREHYVMGCFMNRDFRVGIKAMREQFPHSRWRGRVKMMGWSLLMIFFSRRRVEQTRAWIVSHTPFTWGGWKYYKVWTPPEYVRTLMFR